jgi:PRTRC genetic system ThiF family protein
MRTKTNEHLLPSALLEKQVRITVVGCGGTGSAIAAGLPYLHQAMLAWGHPYGLQVTLVDGDRVSRANCVRQPFSESEIGLYKATVLATRINLFWGLGWKGLPNFLDERWREQTDILIGCVDSRRARKAITESCAYWNCTYWLDLGNNADCGQFVLGQPENDPNKNCPSRLPTVADLFPEITDPKLDKKDKLPSCSAVEALERQEPFINQTLAYHALAMLARLFRYGRLSYHGGFINLTTGRMSSIPVDAGLRRRSESCAQPRPRKSRDTKLRTISKLMQPQASAALEYEHEKQIRRQSTHPRPLELHRKRY